MTRTPKLPTQWVRHGAHPENASNTAARPVRRKIFSYRSLGKINILISAMRPDGGGIKPLIRYRN
jgi:hypothetical protein